MSQKRDYDIFDLALWVWQLKFAVALSIIMGAIASGFYLFANRSEGDIYQSKVIFQAPPEYSKLMKHENAAKILVDILPGSIVQKITETQTHAISPKLLDLEQSHTATEWTFNFEHMNPIDTKQFEASFKPKLSRLINERVRESSKYMLKENLPSNLVDGDVTQTKLAFYTKIAELRKEYGISEQKPTPESRYTFLVDEISQRANLESVNVWFEAELFFQDVGRRQAEDPNVSIPPTDIKRIEELKRLLSVKLHGIKTIPLLDPSKIATYRSTFNTQLKKTQSIYIQAITIIVVCLFAGISLGSLGKGISIFRSRLAQTKIPDPNHAPKPQQLR